MKSTVDIVRVFFAEHPIHSFTIKDIAVYLGISEASIKDAIGTLLRLEIIKTAAYDKTTGVERYWIARNAGRNMPEFPRLRRPQCTEPCEFQSDWTCFHDGSITIENQKCISFVPRFSIILNGLAPCPLWKPQPKGDE